MQIILGSSSVHRAKLMKDAGFEFSVLSPDIDEKAIRHSDPSTMALSIAKAKATALLPQITQPSLLITVDQMVVCDGHVHEKPTSFEEAKLFLQRYSQHPADVLSAVVVTNTANKNSAEIVDISRIYFQPELANELERIQENDIRFDCAGGFQIEGNNFLHSYIDRIEGTLDSIIGLPIELTRRLLDAVKK